MPDYSKSSNNPNKPKDKEASDKAENEGPEKPEKHILKVVEGDVVIKKHGIGRKLKDLVRTIDPKDLGKHLFRDFVLPYSIKMGYDAWVESGNRVFYPHAPKRPIIDARSVQRSIFDYKGISSGSPISRSSTMPLSGVRGAPHRETGPRASSLVQHASTTGEQYLFSSREDAVRVLEQLREALDMYEEPISLGDLYRASGIDSSPVDQKWGWTDLSDVKILQSRDGYILDFPKAEPI